MGMTIENCISKLTEILEEATEDENAVCYMTDVDEPTLKTTIDTMRKYQKIKEQVDIAIDKENFAISGARLIQIREIINGNDD